MIAGVAGLQSNSTALAAISQNIANVNTVGYKTDAVDFQSLVTNGASTGTYSAGGVSTVNQQYVSQQGSATQTSSPTDLAIAGQGMFVTSATSAGLTPNSQVLFTRAGSFTPDNQGYLVNSSGLYLMGWPADSSGAISTSTSLNSLQPINITTPAHQQPTRRLCGGRYD
jgi:flagellar hook protein FlgE